MKISNLLYTGALSTLALMSCTNNDDHSDWYGSEGIVFTQLFSLEFQIMFGMQTMK